jgi:hypothetical protein
MARVSNILIATLASTHAFSISTPPPLARRCVSLTMMANKPETLSAEAAAEAVKKAAAKFGKTQVDAATKWADAAINEENCPTASLLEEQLTLFEACAVDDPDGKCKELDAALSAFDAALVADPTVKDGQRKGPRFSFSFGGNAKEKAAARVRAAASKFGPIQKQVATDFTKKALILGEAADGPSLMDQQVMLFGECAVTDDGKPDPKCVALFQALDDLQLALEGKVVSPSGPEGVAPPNLSPSGSGGGQGGQVTAVFGGGTNVRRNNGCWPY